LEPHFQDIVTAKWLTTSLPVDTICITLDDYFLDYSHLRVRNFEYTITEGINLVAKKYITAMLQKKITFKNYDDRKEAALKIIREADKLKAFFVKIAPKVASFDSPFDALNVLAEVLKIEDPEILSLDLHGLVDKYPDVTQEHLIQLVALRGDLSRSENREMVAHILSTNKERQRPSVPKSIFSHVTGITTGFF
jgi:exocyst complex component 3